MLVTAAAAPSPVRALQPSSRSLPGEPVVVTLPARRLVSERSRALTSLSATDWRIVGALGPDELLVITGPRAAAPAGTRTRPFEPDDKIGPGALEATNVVVHPMPPSTPGDLAVELFRRGFAPRSVVEIGARFIVLRGVDATAIRAIAQDRLTLAVVALPSARPAGIESWGLVQSGLPGLTPLHAAGLGGQGEIVAVADSGLSLGCAFDDPFQAVAQEVIDPTAPPASPLTNPAHRKVHAYQALSVTNFTDEPDTGAGAWHGTAVCGVVVADAPPLAEQYVPPPDALPSDVNANDFDGHAPAARLVVQDLHVAGPDYVLPADLAGLLTAARRAGACTWNASFTSSGGGAYDHAAREIDVATFDNPDLVVTCAAGNVFPPASGTVCAPSTSRNALSVGNAGTGAFVEDVAPTSAWGPAADGRRKPDLVVAGSGVRTSDGGDPCASVRLSGTSIAAPAVAACAALVGEFYREGREAGGFPLSDTPRWPSSALVRATLALGTRGLAGGPEATVDEQEAPSPEQGWGRIVLADALPLLPDARRLVVHDGYSFPIGDIRPDSFALDVLPSAEPLVISLAFTEAPPLPSALSPVVNDLDLEVESPSGVVYLGNVFASGWSAPGGLADPLNNLEIVKVAAPVETGTWTLRVRPTSVIVGPQDYALVSSGRTCLRPLGRFSTPLIVAEVECGSLTVTAPSVGGTPPVTYALFRGTGPGDVDYANPVQAGLPRAAFVDRTPPFSPGYYVIVATDACGTTTSSSGAWGATSSPCTVFDIVLHVTKTGPFAQLSWNDSTNRHDVRRHPAPSAVRGADFVGWSSTGTLVEPMGPERLTCWVVD